jgi:hypothetical protein
MRPPDDGRLLFRSAIPAPHIYGHQGDYMPLNIFLAVPPSAPAISASQKIHEKINALLLTK